MASQTNPHIFRLRLEWKDGMTAGDRTALVNAFEREMLAVHGLQRRVESPTNDGWLTYGFLDRISADAMDDICRAIFRFLRRRRDLHGIGISNRTWYRPRFDPVLDTVDPLLDAMTGPI